MSDFQPAQDEFADVLRTRRTVNRFLPTPVPDQLIMQAIDVARWAPNHKLTEPWVFHVLGPRTARCIIELNREIITAEKGEEAARKKMARWEKVPGWIIVTCQTSSDAVRETENYAAVCCAIQNLMLFLWSRRIGTKWATSQVLQDVRVREILHLGTADQRIVGLVWYGYPAASTESRRRPISDITVLHP